MLFGGEAGVGKSVFLTDILDEVKSTVLNALCGIASCKPSNLKREYVPFKVLLQSLLAPGDTPATINDRALRGILRSPQLFHLCRPDLLFAGDWPDVSRRAAIRGPVPVIAAIDHEHLLRELKAFIADLSQAYPVVIALEDLQWADEASLDLFFSVVSVGVHGSPVLTVGTGRSHKVPPSLASHLDEANRLGAESFLLDFDTTAPFLQKFTGRRSATAFVIRYLKKILPISSARERPGSILVWSLVDDTRGNAFLLSEIVEILRARGEIFRRPGMFYKIWEFRVGKESLIQTHIRAWLRERLDELDDGLVTILKHASISTEGRGFSLDLLCKLLGRDPDDVLKSLEKLDENYKLIEIVRSGADSRERLSRGLKSPYLDSEQEKRPTFLFRHTVLVWYLRSLLTSGEEKRLHRIAGEYLEELYKKNPPSWKSDERTVRADTLAKHFAKAEDYPKAVSYSLDAAKACRLHVNVTDAIRWYRKALELSKCIHAFPREWQLDIEATLAKFVPFESQQSRTFHYGLSASRRNERLIADAKDDFVLRKLWDSNRETKKTSDSQSPLDSRTKIS